MFSTLLTKLFTESAKLSFSSDNFSEVFIAVLIIIALAIVRGNKKDFKLEINKLVDLLGGKDNIIDVEVEMSRFKVTLKDVTKANKEGIMKLGAKGVVEIDDQLKIIFGRDAKKLKRYMDDLK